MMLNHLLHLQLDLGAIRALGRNVALHEGAVVADGDPGVRVDVVPHAGDVLPGVVSVSVRDGVHVVAEGVHDAELGGADAHDRAALAVQAHVHLVHPLDCGGYVCRLDKVDAVWLPEFSPARGVERGRYGYTVVCDVANAAARTS